MDARRFHAVKNNAQNSDDITGCEGPPDPEMSLSYTMIHDQFLMHDCKVPYLRPIARSPTFCVYYINFNFFIQRQRHNFLVETHLDTSVKCLVNAMELSNFK